MKRIVLTLAAGVTVAACSAAPDADGPALRVASVTDLGALPLPSATTLGRDGGTGGTLAGKSLWTFGDTFTSQPNAIDGSSVLSATAGWSTPAEPLALVQPVDAAGFPAQLIPYTADEIAANKADALNGWALWPSALIDTGNAGDTGDAQGLVVFQRIRRMGGSGFASQGVGTARIAVDATTATRTAGDLFAPPEPLFMPAFAADGFVYAMACASSGFLDQSCELARAPIAQAETRAAYMFWDGSSYQADIGAAVAILDRAGNAPTIVFNPHLGRYLAVTGEVLASTVLLRTAPAIEGPWDAGVEIAPSATGVLAPTSSSDYDYIMLEHPELDAADGTQIVISYSRPTAPFRGDVRLARVTLD